MKGRVILALSLAVNFGLLGWAAWQLSRSSRPPQNPLVVSSDPDTRVIKPGDVAQFPQPRLETNERVELNGFRLAEEQELHSYGWVDKSGGVVHIPIEVAMQLLAQRGLPDSVP